MASPSFIVGSSSDGLFTLAFSVSNAFVFCSSADAVFCNSPETLSRLALRLKPVIAERAKEKQAEYFGNQYESGLPQKSAEVQKPIETREELAKVAGVSHDTIAKVEKIEQKATPEIKTQLQTGEISINQAYKTVKKEENRQKRQESRCICVLRAFTAFWYISIYFYT